MEPEPSARPLTAAPADRALYVRRDADDAVDRAVGFGFNTMLASARGMGATSLLYRLEGAYPERTTYLASAGGGAALELLDALGDRLGPVAAGGRPGRDGGRDPLDALDRRLRDRGADAATPWMVLLDGPVGADAAHELFGTARDALFALPLRWVVVAP